VSDATKVPAAELRRRLQRCPEQGSEWRHYKGGDYHVVGAAIAEATQEPQVVYRPRHIDPPLSFCRPLAEWHEEVEHEGRRVPRFRRLAG
jgi:hypothetical protein